MNEKLTQIAKGEGCSKPEIAISPDGTAYIVYEKDNDIHLSMYKEGKASYVKNISDSPFKSYEPDISIKNNGCIHIAWCEYLNGNNSISYWNSKENYTKTLGNITGENIEDLRISSDINENVFIVFMQWPDAFCKFISIYNDEISFEGWPVSGRQKHPDIYVDNDYIYVICQYKKKGDYQIVCNKRKNLPGSRWEEMVSLDSGHVQRPRFSPSDELLNVIYHKGIDPKRTIYYKSNFNPIQISESGQAFRYIDIKSLDGKNMIFSTKKGRHIYYNFQIDGVWEGYKQLNSSDNLNPQKQSLDINQDKAILVFASGDSEIYLVEMENKITKPEDPITPVDPPEEPPIIGEDMEKIKELKEEIVELKRLLANREAILKLAEKEVVELKNKYDWEFFGSVFPWDWNFKELRKRKLGWIIGIVVAFILGIII